MLGVSKLDFFFLNKIVKHPNIAEAIIKQN